jgi:hypothetical protein
MQRLLLAMLLTLSQFTAFAQTLPTSIKGVVRCGKTPVEGSIVALLQPSDSSVVAYAMTNKQGFYQLQTTTSLSELLIKVTGFGIKRQLSPIKNQTQTFDFSVEKEDIKLREAVVKSQKIWGNRDTLNYLVSAYLKDYDRTIADVLRKLPGITIEDNGNIKYQGTPINHFYIENLDMLQGRYNLATQSIKAEDVATVQVLENHEHAHALQDQMPSANAAINLKLKNKAKGIWSQSVEVGSGAYAEGMLWKGTARAMYFGKAQQHLLQYSGDNMGNGLDAALAHYGVSANTNRHMMDLVKHATPAIGNSWFGYQHGLHLNNLAKLTDSATINYNFNYSYNLSRGSSFAQTRYLLPDASQLLLRENIADRTHTNTADLQLTYEKNLQRNFLYNSFSLLGQWEEGKGDILSEYRNPLALSLGTQKATAIQQALHYRSLGLLNRTRWVHRTSKGGGFEWNSTQSFSSSPQALSIGGDMRARQDVDLTTIYTSNKVELLQNLRTRNWTLSGTAHFDATYTAATTSLSHPDALIAPHGHLTHLQTIVGVGPVLNYTKGSFQSTLKLPFTFHYTALDNNQIVEEITDAHRLQARFLPSWSLLWKVTNETTFNAKADYTAQETSWDRLLTANVMQNYKNLSRHRALLHDNHKASAQFVITYKDLFNGLFAHLKGNWNRMWSNIAYGTTLDAQAHTVVEAAYRPNHSHQYSITAYGRKDIDWQTLQCELSATGGRGEREMLLQSSLLTYHTTNYVLSGVLSFDLFNGCRMDYNATWQHHRSKTTFHTFTTSDLEQRANLHLRLWPSRMFLKLHMSHTHNNHLGTEQKDFYYIGGELKFKLSKGVELQLNGDNLSNTRSLITHSLEELEEVHTVYHLRPLSISLTAHINL